MTALSDLLASFLKPLLNLLPRIYMRPASNECCVVDAWWRKPYLHRGPILFIPALTHVEYLTAAQVPVDTCLQSLTSADGKSVSVNVTAIVKISDPLLLRESVELEDWTDLASQKVRAVVNEVVTGHNWGDVIERGSDLIFDDSAIDLEEIGIDLLQIVLEDSVVSLPIRLLGA